MKTLKSIFALALLGVAVLFSGCTKKVDLISFSVSPSSKTLTTVGESFEVTVTPIPADAAVDFVWTSSDNGVATVSKKDKLIATITAVANGTATITAVSGAASKTVSVTVNIGSAPIEDGDGSQNAPYNVAQGIANQGKIDDSVWVKGYIVGVVKSGTSTVASASDVEFATPFSSNTNVLIADDANETDYNKCIAVNLPTAGTVRSTVNLNTHPENLGATLKVKGKLRKYFGIAGSRDSKGTAEWFELSGVTQPPVPTGTLFSETMLTQESFNKFSVVSVEGDLEWVFDASYGAKMSGYDTESHKNEDWLISPVVDLSSVSNATLSFMHARGPAGSIEIGVSEGWYKVYVTSNYTEDIKTTSWTELTNVTHGTTAWQYVSSGDLVIPAEARTTTMRFAFKYLSEDGSSATWEIKDISVKGE
ncbi:MAG: Ig-like domain-containing protein [Bacteroidales bacterium]|jgi:hypothetical protein|nr:Ig-like domain-containing protein [Bacteroidales bacterium]